VICYAIARRKENVSGRSPAGRHAVVIWAAAGTVTGVCPLTLFASVSHQLLPRIMLGHDYTIVMVVVNVSVLLLSLAALGVLGSRTPYSKLDLALIVVLCALNQTGFVGGDFV